MKKDEFHDLDDLIDDVKKLLDDQPAETTGEPAPDPKEDYSEWLYRQGGEAPAAEKPPKKKHRFWKVLLWLLGILIAGCLAMWFLFAKQPAATEDTLGARRAGSSTILLAGTDAGGTRTDTMVLLNVDQSARTVSLISIPRDTYVSGYSVPKLNSALGAGGGGKEGMAELMDRVTELIGYRPDGYVLVELDGFRRIVDAIGGVEFDVPMEMHYSDPAQDLTIDLAAGPQRLDGEKAMELVRFRSGYAQADLARVEVQRDFLKAAIQQTVSLKNLPKAPALLPIVLANTTTDLDSANLTWMAKTLLVCDKDSITMQTMPGRPQMIGGGSYYLIDASAAAELLNEHCNPYETAITPEMLHVRS